MIHGLGFLDVIDIIDEESVDGYLSQIDDFTETAGRKSLNKWYTIPCGIKGLSVAKLMTVCFTILIFLPFLSMTLLMLLWSMLFAKLILLMTTDPFSSGYIIFINHVYIVYYLIYLQ